MRRLSIALALAAGVVTDASAQATISELSAPTSPAFVLLGVAPASVDRPESAKALIVNAFSKLSTTDGLPKDFAIEVTPFWMKSNRTLSFEEYQNPGAAAGLWQSLRVSVATAPIQGTGASADPLGTKLAIGFNTKIFNGRPNPTMNAALESLFAENTKLLAADRELEGIEDTLATRREELAEATEDAKRADLIAIIGNIEKTLVKKQAEIGNIEAGIRSRSLAVQALDAVRVGFFLAVAGGQVWDFLNDDTENGRSGRRGLWVTPAYRMLRCDSGCEMSFDFIGVARMLKDPDTDAMIDIGGRLVWRPTTRFSTSFELLRRNAPDSAGASLESVNDSNRAAALLEYRIQDDLILFGTFGQDFEKATGAKPLITLMGLNFGFGQQAMVRQ
jgi:hypothetical protein